MSFPLASIAMIDRHFVNPVQSSRHLNRAFFIFCNHYYKIIPCVAPIPIMWGTKERRWVRFLGEVDDDFKIPRSR